MRLTSEASFQTAVFFSNAAEANGRILLAAMPQPALLVNGALEVVFANAPFCEQSSLQFSPGVLPLLPLVQEGKWFHPDLKLLLQNDKKNQAVLFTCAHAGHSFSCHARRMDFPDCIHPYLLLSFEKIKGATTAPVNTDTRNPLVEGLMETSLDCVKVLDLGANLLEMNRHGQALMELDNFQQVAGKCWVDFWAGDAGSTAAAAVKQALQGEVSRFTAFCPTLKNTPKWWEVTVGPVKDTEGIVCQLISISRDITQTLEEGKELNRSRELVKSLYEESPDCLKIMDLEGNILSLNEAGRSLLELDAASQMTGVNWINLWKGEYHEYAKKAVEQAIGGSTGQFTAFCPSSKGKPMWWDVVVTPVRNEVGQVVQLVSACRDITHKKALEQIKEDSDHRLRLALESAQLGVWEHSLETDRFWCDACVSSFYDCLPETQLDIPLFIASVHPEDREWVLEAIATANKQNRPHLSFEHRILTQAGNTKWLKMVSKGVFDTQGKLVGRLGILQEITAQKNAQLQLQQSESRYRAIFTEAPVAIWEEDYSKVQEGIEQLQAKGVTDFADYFSQNPQVAREILHQMRVLDVNEAAVKLFRAESKQDLIHRILEVFIPESFGMLVKWLIALANRESHFETEIQMQTLYGDKIWVIGKINFPYESDFTKVLVSITDITERKRLEEEVQAYSARIEQKVEERTRALQEANTALERSNKELEEFAYVASHDLQEPLRKIRTFADRLQAGASELLPEQQQAYIEKIISSSQRMTELIRGLLDFSCLHARQNLVRVNLSDVLRQVLSDFDLLVEQKAARITCEPLPVVAALPRQMTQLFQNLIGNALKFTRDGVPPVISITATPLCAEDVHRIPDLKCPEYYQVITVRDNGIGFHPNYAERIFNIFQRLHSRSEFEGTGIGLAICKKIVNNIGGAMWAESVEGSGAAFSFALPVWEQD